jgi:hypothetical protein
MKNYKILVIIATLLLTVATSCHDALDTAPLSTLAPENFFNNLKEAEIGVNGVYDKMAEHYKQNLIYMSDHGSHVATIFLNNPNLDLYGKYTYTNSDRFVTGTWKTAYEAIYRANVVINRVGQMDTEDPLKNRVIAEARFLRALTYFNLVRFYGDVPLILDELLDLDNPEITNKGRTSASLVYDAIIEDLKFAETNLYLAPWVSDLNTPSYDGSGLGRATAGAAKGLLAKVYLTRASYPERDAASYQLAYDKAKEVITDATYSLDADYFNLNSLEGKTSQEWLFQIQYNVLGEQSSNWGGLHNPRNQGSAGKDANDWGYGRVSPTWKFSKSFETGDLRFGSIAQGKINADGTIKYYPKTFLWHSHKYRFSSRPLSRFDTDMNAPVLRYADILLIYAESAAELGLNSDAHVALNMVLTRAQNGGTSPALVAGGLTGDALKEFIFWERARELCFEGHAKFDIVRAGLDKFLAEVKGQEESVKVGDPSKTRTVSWSNNVQPYHLLFPIPAAEMSANPNMTQNDGY